MSEATWNDVDSALLSKLNRGSWDKTFSPEADIDWQSPTTPAEFRALYDAWSLLLGSRHDAALDDEGRVRFATYQQMNLMLFTALFERFALSTFEQLYSDDDDDAFQEYVSHLIKEETYHYLLFARAVSALRATDKALLKLPQRHLEWYLRWCMFWMRRLPRRLRHGTFFFFLRFAEEITLQANTMARRVINREASLVSRVWQLHALDEARHVAFDDLMMRRAALPGPLKGLPRSLTIPLCVGASLLLNLNELWAARRLGVKVSYFELPKLVKNTTAPFKRRVFSILFDRPPAAADVEASS